MYTVFGGLCGASLCVVPLDFWNWLFLPFCCGYLSLYLFPLAGFFLSFSRPRPPYYSMFPVVSQVALYFSFIFCLFSNGRDICSLSLSFVLPFSLWFPHLFFFISVMTTSPAAGFHRVILNVYLVVLFLFPCPFESSARPLHLIMLHICIARLF